MSDENTGNADPAATSADEARHFQEEAPDVEISERSEPDPVSANVDAGTDPDLLTDDQADR